MLFFEKMQTHMSISTAFESRQKNQSVDGAIVTWRSFLCVDLNHWLEKTYLLNGLEMVLHAFNGNIFACFNALGLEDFRESAFTLFAYQSVLLHFILYLLIA